MTDTRKLRAVPAVFRRGSRTWINHCEICNALYGNCCHHRKEHLAHPLNNGLVQDSICGKSLESHRFTPINRKEWHLINDKDRCHVCNRDRNIHIDNEENLI